MKMPNRFLIPPEFREAMLISELNKTPEEIDKIPERTLDLLLLYNNVKNVTQFGGELNL